MTDPNTQRTSPGEVGPLPDPLVRDLRHLAGRVPSVPAGVEIELFERAAVRARSRRRLRLMSAWSPVAAAACVALLWATGVMAPGGAGSRGEWARHIREWRSHAPGARVDILDALALAKAVDAGRARDGSLDLTGDGVVDRRDVDAVGFAAVRLAPGGRS